MNVRDSFESLREFWSEFSKVKSGLVGLAFLVVFVALALFGPAIVPYQGAKDHWRDINFWQDNPQNAPPVWVNWLPWNKKKGVASSVLSDFSLVEEQSDGVVVRKYEFPYEFEYDEPPRDVIVRFQGNGSIPMDITLVRPDGLSAELYREQLDIAEGMLQRISIERNCAKAVIDFVRSNNEYLGSRLNFEMIKPNSILFSELNDTVADTPTALKGKYSLVMTVLILDGSFSFERPSVVVSGHVSGLLGTDMAKRDIFTGIIIGVRWALIIGVLTSVLNVLLGVFMGVSAAYFGGAVDWSLNRLYEFIYLMPVLPFLIVISAIFKPTIWTLIIIICLFFWTGPYKPVYSMALQIREETYVEASRALGSGRWRIIFKHIIPILLPYTFAVMALSVPGIIVYEASVSLLGLGDATKVTLGQILHDALFQGAVINNLWWWVVPPGLLIALMGMTFAFLGTALDKILHPKLKTR